MTVEIRTSSSAFAGTDDDVYLRIGPTPALPARQAALRRLRARRPRHLQRPDRRRDAGGLTVGDITRVQIEKSPDGVAGGWKLRGVKLVVNGRTLYARDGIERWLEDDHRTWRAPDFRPTRAARAGAADHARPVGRGLVRLRRQRPRRHQPLRPPQAARARVLPGTRRPRPATGGSFLSGRLGDGDKARVTYTIETLTPTPRAAAAAAAAAAATPPQPEPEPAAQARPRDQRDGLRRDARSTTSPSRTRAPAAAGAFTVEVTGEGSFAIPGLAAGRVGDPDVPDGVQGRDAARRSPTRSRRSTRATRRTTPAASPRTSASSRRLAARRDLLHGPGVAVRVVEEHEPDVVERVAAGASGSRRGPGCRSRRRRARRAGPGPR